jgi:biotin carboxyl carrier protein
MKLQGPRGIQDVRIPTHARIHFSLGVVEIPDEQGVLQTVHFARHRTDVWVCWKGYTAKFSLPTGTQTEWEKEIRAPMTGKLVAVNVKLGDKVSEGSVLAILEAMKMEYRLEAPVEGTVAEVQGSPGDLVDLGQLIVRLE